MGEVQVFYQDWLASNLEHRQHLAKLLDGGAKIIAVFQDGGHPNATAPTGNIVVYVPVTDEEKNINA